MEFESEIFPAGNPDSGKRQHALVRDGYGAQAKSVKEIGTALKAAGVLKGRASVNGRRTRVYHLPDWIAEINDLPEF